LIVGIALPSPFVGGFPQSVVPQSLAAQSVTAQSVTEMRNTEERHPLPVRWALTRFQRIAQRTRRAIVPSYLTVDVRSSV
jgi:hypothetical protein